MSGIIAVNMYIRKELLHTSGFQGQASPFHVAVGGYERNRMSLEPSNSNLHLSWQREGISVGASPLGIWNRDEGQESGVL